MCKSSLLDINLKKRTWIYKGDERLLVVGNAERPLVVENAERPLVVGNGGEVGKRWFE